MPEVTYVLIEAGRGIKCLRCGRISWNRNDVRFLYCGYCKVFHE